MRIFAIILLAFCLFVAPTNNIQADASESYLDYVKERTVLVYRSCEKKSENGWGSGVIIDGNKVLTAEHVVDDLEGCEILIKRGDEPFYYSAIEKEDKRLDLALLVVAHDYGVTVSFARSKLGEAITVVGYPTQLIDRSKLYLSVLYGYISTKNILSAGENRYVDRISAPIYFGNSGGPVFNSVGQVVGIISSGHMDVQGYFYTVRGHDLLKFLGEE